MGPAPGDHPSLAPDALLAAYAHGYFPMDAPGEEGPVGLYEADPRSIIPVDVVRIPRSVRRGVARAGYEVRVDAAFDAFQTLLVEPSLGAGDLALTLGHLGLVGAVLGAVAAVVLARRPA